MISSNFTVVSNLPVSPENSAYLVECELPGIPPHSNKITNIDVSRELIDYAFMGMTYSAPMPRMSIIRMDVAALMEFRTPNWPLVTTSTETDPPSIRNDQSRKSHRASRIPQYPIW